MAALALATMRLQTWSPIIVQATFALLILTTQYRNSRAGVWDICNGDQNIGSDHPLASLCALLMSTGPLTGPKLLKEMVVPPYRLTFLLTSGISIT